MAQTGQAAALEFALALTETVFLQHDGRRVHNDQARVAIDDDAVILPNQAAGLPRAHHRRDVHAAGHNRGVRGLAPHIGHKAFEHAALEGEHVGRGNVAGHQHQGFIAAKIARLGIGHG